VPSPTIIEKSKKASRAKSTGKQLTGSLGWKRRRPPKPTSEAPGDRLCRGSQFDKLVAERHAEFVHPSFVGASFVSPNHGPGSIECSLNRGNHDGISPTRWSVERPHVILPMVRRESCALSHPRACYRHAVMANCAPLPRLWGLKKTAQSSSACGGPH